MYKERVVHIYNGILNIKKNDMVSFLATRMDLDIIILSKLSQKEKYHTISLICGV